MRGGKSGSLKGKNKWVRPENVGISASAQSNPPPKPNSADGAGHDQPASKKVGKFALARDSAPKKATTSSSPMAVNRTRFKYERPKDSAAAAVAAAAVLPPPPSLAQTTAVGARKIKPVVCPGKLRWNKYVRQSIGGGEGGETGRQQPATAVTTGIASGLPVPVLSNPLPPAATTLLSAADLQRRRRSKRISAASELVRKHQGGKIAQRTQHATKLLRLGGQLYSVGGPRGKGRSLKLQKDTITNTATTAAPTTAPLPPPSSAAAPGKNTALLTTTTRSTSSSKLAAQKWQIGKQKKPMSRLKGGRLVYCPVYCHTGRCPRRGRGCPLRHDPTKRAVCPLWIRGKCSLGITCPLQHQRRPELMPACVHYLQGRCTNSNCPYLHVDLPSNAPHCAAFLRGYCAAGVECASKHYTLKQIKEERKMIAGKEAKKKEKAAKQQQRLGGRSESGQDRKLKMKRKKRRGRYFDQEPEADEEQEDKEKKGDASSNSESDDREEEEGGRDDDVEDRVMPTSSSDTSLSGESDTDDADNATEIETSEEEDGQEPSRKRSRRLTGAPLPDFIGL